MDSTCHPDLCLPVEPARVNTNNSSPYQSKVNPRSNTMFCSSSASRSTSSQTFSSTILRIPFLVLLALFLQSFTLDSFIWNFAHPYWTSTNSCPNSYELESLSLVRSPLFSTTKDNLPTSFLQKYTISWLLPTYFALFATVPHYLNTTSGSRFLNGPVRRGSSVFAMAAGDDYDYDYGDPSSEFEFHPPGEVPNTAQSRSDAFADKSLPAAQHGPLLPSHSSNAAAPTLPLCCPEGQVYNYARCTAPASDASWRPKLEAAPAAVFRYSAGFPRCPGRNRQPAEVYQTEVFFHNRSLYLPPFIQKEVVHPDHYCIVKVEESQSPAASPTCPRFSTKVFACTLDPQALDGAAWTLVGLSHLLLVFAIAAYIIVPDLRALQGQYLLCLLITLLLYNLLLLPTSAITFPASLVSCMALRAIKYFFFCGFFLWFNIICFDVWRTVRSGQDISGRRRFLAYSCYAWLLSAVLATAVLVLDITNGKAMQGADAGPGGHLPECQLGLHPHVVLQLLQGLSVLVDAVMLVMAVSGLCTYSKLVCRLPRSDAVASVKQVLKLFAVMICHSILSVSPEFLKITVITLWQFVVLEAVAVVGILVYRRSILKQLYRRCICCCYRRSNTKRRYGSGVAGAATGGATASSGGADSSVASMNGGTHNLNHQEQQFIVPEKIRLSSV